MRNRAFLGKLIRKFLKELAQNTLFRKLQVVAFGCVHDNRSCRTVFKLSILPRFSEVSFLEVQIIYVLDIGLFGIGYSLFQIILNLWL